MLELRNAGVLLLAVLLGCTGTATCLAVLSGCVMGDTGTFHFDPDGYQEPTGGTEESEFFTYTRS